VEDQAADFNGLPCSLILSIRVGESSVRHSAGTAIELAVIALDQGNFLRLLSVAEVPFVLGIGLNGQCLALAVGIDQTDGHQVCLWYTVSIGDSERVLENLLDGTPDIDNLVSCLQQLVGDLRQMVRDA
jgi:hypothetical protein